MSSVLYKFLVDVQVKCTAKGCGADFLNVQQRDNHVERLHMGPKLFMCTYSEEHNLLLSLDEARGGMPCCLQGFERPLDFRSHHYKSHNIATQYVDGLTISRNS